MRQQESGSHGPLIIYPPLRRARVVSAQSLGIEHFKLLCDCGFQKVFVAFWVHLSSSVSLLEAGTGVVYRLMHSFLQKIDLSAQTDHITSSDIAGAS